MGKLFEAVDSLENYTLKEANEGPCTYKLIYETYERYEAGRIGTKTFKAKTLTDAVIKIADKLGLYIEPEEVLVNGKTKEQQAEETGYDVEDIMTAEEAIESIKESNGDGCDFIALFKNETTGETYIDEQDALDDEDDDWDDEFDESAKLNEDSNEAYDLVEAFEDAQWQFFTVDEWNAMDRDMTPEEQDAHHRELLEPVVEAFLKQNKKAVIDNWDDFKNQMENDNHHTALAMFKEKLNIKESTKLKESDGDCVFNLHINCSNEVFEGMPNLEVNKILKKLAGNIEYTDEKKTILDTNGNTVGSYSFGYEGVTESLDEGAEERKSLIDRVATKTANMIVDETRKLLPDFMKNYTFDIEDHTDEGDNQVTLLGIFIKNEEGEQLESFISINNPVEDVDRDYWHYRETPNVLYIDVCSDTPEETFELSIRDLDDLNKISSHIPKIAKKWAEVIASMNM